MEVLSKKYLQNCRFAANRYDALASLTDISVIAEIGVLAGDLSFWMLKQYNPSELHLIDLYNCADFPGRDRFSKKQHEQFVKERFENEIQSGIVQLKKGYSWKVLREYPDHYFDLIYIDAGHDYSSVRKDLEQAILKIRPGGRIVMNDYIMYDHILNTKYGVVQATNEFCIAHQWEFEFFAFHPNLFCDVILREIV